MDSCYTMGQLKEVTFELPKNIKGVPFKTKMYKKNTILFFSYPEVTKKYGSHNVKTLKIENYVNI